MQHYLRLDKKAFMCFDFLYPFLFIIMFSVFHFLSNLLVLFIYVSYHEKWRVLL